MVSTEEDYQECDYDELSNYLVHHNYVVLENENWSILNVVK